MNDPKKRLPIYAQLLKLYPAAYRQRYEQEILLAAGDLLDEASSRTARLAVKARLATDLSLNIGKQRLIALGEQGYTQAPSYVKYNAYAAALLLLPFILALTANATAKILFGHTLYHSWLWQSPYIGLWVLYFPLFALFLAAGGYLAYVLRRSEGGERSLLQKLLDVRHLWPVLLTGIFAFGLLFVVIFHDSGRCWMYAPGSAVTHLKQSLQCTEANRVSFKKIFEKSL